MAISKQYLGGTKAVSPEYAVDERALLAHLEAAIPEFEGPIEDLRQFEGGQSNPTYRLKAKSGSYVLRRKPPGEHHPSAHAVEREFRVMKALGEQGFPVPPVLELCEDKSIIGSAFYLMEHVEGRVFWDPLMPDLTPADRRAAYATMADTLADLHNLNLDDLGLSDYGKPGNYFARQVGRWSKQYNAAAAAPLPAMTRLMEWLPTAIPDDDETTLIHGDYGCHNVMLSPTAPEIVAVLDWELSTLGHPISDLAYCLIPWYRPDVDDGRSSFKGIDHEAMGVPTMEEFAARYFERRGKPPVEDLDFYCAFNLFRAAAIGEGIVARARSGVAVGTDAASFAETVTIYAEAGLAHAIRAGA